MELFRPRRRTLAALLACALLLCAAAACYKYSRKPKPVPEKYAFPVLMYHHMVEDGQDCNDMTVTASRFEEDLQWLTAHGYTTVLPRELAAGDPLPKKPVMITFDDGYRSNYSLLYPLLQKYQAKAVISVIVYMPDNWADDFINWYMCREMVESGLVEIGSHSYFLHNLGDLGGNYVPDGPNGIQRWSHEDDAAFRARVLDDIQRSYDVLKENVGAAPTFFAYPFGAVEPDAAETIERLFPVTAVTGGAVADRRNGWHDLPRLAVTMNKGLDVLLERYA